MNNSHLDWCKQFSHATGERDPRTNWNFFSRVDLNEIAEFRSEFGQMLPSSYESFLVDVGFGYLREDLNFKRSSTYDNGFLSLTEIAEILRKESPEWEIYEDFIGDDEVPFFSPAVNSVFVFKKGEERVLYPGGGTEYASTFDQFLIRLTVDCNFYTQIGK